MNKDNWRMEWRGLAMKMFRIEMRNEFEADVFCNILEEEGIPYTVLGNDSLVYDGLFKMTLGWGHVEVPEEHKDKALELLRKYKESSDV
ncbi:MAG TPA: DUF2007 domain-containing protein [Clostridia bacterium]|nr:DUF2007 domain-containing protein [Clostridia bacterium]